MSFDYSASLNGLWAAEQAMNQVAWRIAYGNMAVLSGRAFENNSGVSGDADADSVTISGVVDYASEMVAMSEAKLAAKANLKVMATQRELEHEILDIFA
jgi:hypothetical protein